jgi:hypothetical protein
MAKAGPCSMLLGREDTEAMKLVERMQVPKSGLLPEMRSEPFAGSLLIRPMRREYPATSATRIAVRRRTEGMARPVVKVPLPVYLETRGDPSIEIAVLRVILPTPWDAGLCARARYSAPP